MKKPELHALCTALLEQKLSDLAKSIQDVRESVASDTKSSMGDKYETAREMAQQELGKLQQQEAITRQLLLGLKTLDATKVCNTVTAGALVKTDKMWFYLAAGIGKVEMGQENMMVISLQSPLGRALNGKSAGETAQVNGVIYRILEVV